ncbi:phosphatase PAP2 family protein [Nocardia sp. CS682]|uniref:phosphatase PAP2 family protein n=1 Tax=Nocardia sp. CS682 TaxID=1047172 RepID=UPI00107524FB|nr:phosphatase PAP2 family protein [Nocardia sp. CS682]QBS45354.1 phosphatase PAP2 family protein [Nocardia sp. CS682]
MTVRRRALDGWLVVGGAVGTGLCAVAAAAALTDQGDRTLFLHINALPDALYRPLWIVQLIGVLGAPIAVAALAVGTRRFRLAAGLVLLVPTKLVVERDVLKQLVHRPRPGAMVPEAILRDVPTAGSAFPSGHAMIVFAMVVLLSPYVNRRAQLALAAAALLAAVARIYLGAHTPLDVLGGAAAGITLGALLNLAVGVGPAASGPRDDGPPHPSRSPLPGRGRRWESTDSPTKDERR